MALGPAVFDLSGRVAVVTGAAQGIGRATALALASFGADLAVCDRDGEGLAALAGEVHDLGRDVVDDVLDVRDDAALDRFFAAVEDRFGRLDVLVNNAGGGFPGAFADLSANAEKALVDENFTSVAHVTRRALPLLGDGGAIVNITSIEAHRAGPGYSVYSAMKAAVENLTKSLALELADRRIRVNAVAPDVIPTPGVGTLPITTPLPYAGHPDDVAAAVVFLASGASRFTTGTTLHVDGGNAAAAGWRRQPDGTFHP